MSDGIDFKISEGLIKPIIEAKINTAIIEAMGGHERMIAEMVTSYMSQKVDDKGNPSNYSTTKPRVDWLADKMLSEAMKASLERFMETKQKAIERAFEKFFASQAGRNQLIGAIQEGIVESLKNKWQTEIRFTPRNG